MKLLKLSCLTAAAVTLFAIATAVQATPCTVLNNMSVTPNALCGALDEVDPDTQPNPGDIDYNFPPAGWVELAIWEGDEDPPLSGNTLAGLTMTGQGGTSGTFSFNQWVWDHFESVAVSLRAGSAGGVDSWTAWLLTPEVLTYTWNTCVDGDCSGETWGGRGISGIRLWVRGGHDVPEPSTLGLLGLGLAGVGLVVGVRGRKA